MFINIGINIKEKFDIRIEKSRFLNWNIKVDRILLLTIF